ncbi:hypothetical protein DPMN_045723 [Dreissena polymorpha]|uniref:Secreted protein n=1 Tax=Dreissena polymorpha TaxID=45954 RepID=A0A9D4I1M5_DREPO|nr:hypothetical protein DPMN_045723 [Dreissena polymorpha]
MSASSWRTLSCLHLYLPCVRAVWQDDSVFSSVPIFPQSEQVGSSCFPHLCRFAGEGSRSLTDLSRKLMRRGSLR